jgi:thioredoxin reductase (NADPH)
VENIYAIGDVLHGKLELTPVAIKAGRLLANRLFSEDKEMMDYVNVPTTVFTPLEYGAVGYTEEEAQKEFGAENISTFHTKFKPLEWNVNKMAANGDRQCYTKVIVHKFDQNRVVGYHICAPNAGEVTQGVGMAINCGMTKQQMDSCVGIHPTVAEDSIGLEFTKEEHGEVEKTSC